MNAILVSLIIVFIALVTCGAYYRINRVGEPRGLIFTGDEVALYVGGREVWKFTWSDVTKIEVYKIDAFSVDLVCLDFTVASRHETYRTDEDMQNSKQLCNETKRCFPSIGTDWTYTVLFPPFAQNYRILYERV